MIADHQNLRDAPMPVARFISTNALYAGVQKTKLLPSRV